MLAGICSIGGINTSCALRYNPDGSLDAGFGAGGTITTVTGSAESVNALVIRTDGKLLLAGSCQNNFCVRRYKSDGSPDHAFGDGTSGTAMVTTGLNVDRIRSRGAARWQAVAHWRLQCRRRTELLRSAP